jgi:hypothetical protein
MNTPNYYTVTPAEVRYDKDLSFFEIVLYGEIVALTGRDGHCWATNQYFADLYSQSERTISKSINQLAKNGHIIVEIDKDNGNTRILKLPSTIWKKSSTPIEKKCDPLWKKSSTPIYENNININNNPEVSNDTSTPLQENSAQNPTCKENLQVRNRFRKPTIQELKTEITQKGYAIDPEAFFDYYESKGWLIGKSLMKDWRAALRTWKRNNFGKVQRHESKMERNSRIIDEYFDELKQKYGNKNFDFDVDVELLQ